MNIQPASLAMPIPEIGEVAGAGNVESASGNAFSKMLETLEGMQVQQVESQNKITDVMLGHSDNTHGALIAMEKASLQMEMAKTVQEKGVQSVNQLMNMQI